MTDYVYDREMVEMPEGGPYERVWLCEPPERGSTFRVIRDEWSFDLAVPVRTIHAWVQAD